MLDGKRMHKLFLNGGKNIGKFWVELVKSIHIVIFWVMKPCSLVSGYQCFEETY
jgi:hypothetical protein